MVYAVGEEAKSIAACEQVVKQEIARPVMVGRQAVIERRIGGLGLSMQSGRGYESLIPMRIPNMSAVVTPSMSVSEGGAFLTGRRAGMYAMPPPWWPR